MSLWLEALDKEQYLFYQSHVQHMCSEDTGMKAIKFSANTSFLGIASLRNVQVHNHKDKGDVRDGLVGMTCVGGFTGGELYLPGLEMKLRYLPGDMILLPSEVLQHFINATIGERSSVVFFSQSSPSTITQNVRYLSKDDQAFQDALQKRNETTRLMQEKEERKRKFESLPPYETKDENLDDLKRMRARRRKKRMEAFAQADLKAGKISAGEMKRLEETDAAAFYELNMVELGRHAKKEYPFAPMKDKDGKRMGT